METVSKLLVDAALLTHEPEILQCILPKKVLYCPSGNQLRATSTHCFDRCYVIYEKIRFFLQSELQNALRITYKAIETSWFCLLVALILLSIGKMIYRYDLF